MQEMDSITREQKSDQDRFDNENRKKNELIAKIKQKENEMEENRKRVEKLDDYVRFVPADLTIFQLLFVILSQKYSYIRCVSLIKKMHFISFWLEKDVPFITSRKDYNHLKEWNYMWNFCSDFCFFLNE